MKLDLSKEWYESHIPKEDCLDCGACKSCIDRIIAVRELEADKTNDEIQAAVATWKGYLSKPCRPPYLCPSDDEIQAAYVLADAFLNKELEAGNTNELIEAMKEDFAIRLADAEAKIAEYRQALTRLASYAATAEDENTREWMDGLVEHLNATAKTIEDSKQFVLHWAHGVFSTWITVRDMP